MLPTEDLYVSPVLIPGDKLERYDGVEILHIPTRLVYRSVSERSSHLNLKAALAGIEKKVKEYYQSKRDGH